MDKSKYVVTAGDLAIHANCPSEAEGIVKGMVAVGAKLDQQQYQNPKVEKLIDGEWIEVGSDGAEIMP